MTGAWGGGRGQEVATRGLMHVRIFKALSVKCHWWAGPNTFAA